MVDDISLDPLIVAPDLVGVNNYISIGRTVLSRCEVPHQEGHLLVDHRMVAQLRDDMDSERAEVGSCRPLSGCVASTFRSAFQFEIIGWQFYLNPAATI